MKHIFLQIFLFTLLVAFGVVGFLSEGVKLAQAQPPQPPQQQPTQKTNPLYGWGWSSNIGWISLNCDNPGLETCGDVEYGVEIGSGGELQGWGWSPYVGWIKFSELSGFPSGSGTQAQTARIAGNKVIGWGRAYCAIDPSSCNDPNLPSQYLPNLGGWDGWISFDGTDYGVAGQQQQIMSINNKGIKGFIKKVFAQGPQQGTQDVFEGFAWGDDVMGWIKFNLSTDREAIEKKPFPLGKFVALSVEPVCVGPSGGDVVLSWTSNDVTSCTTSSNPSNPDWNNATIALPEGSWPLQNVNGGDPSVDGDGDVFSINCDGVSDEIEIDRCPFAPPSVDIKANGSDAIPVIIFDGFPGDKDNTKNSEIGVELSWTTSTVENCTVPTPNEVSNSNPPWSGSKDTVSLGYTIENLNLDTLYQFVLRCDSVIDGTALSDSAWVYGLKPLECKNNPVQGEDLYFNYDDQGDPIIADSSGNNVTDYYIVDANGNCFPLTSQGVCVDESGNIIKDEDGNDLLVVDWLVQDPGNYVEFYSDNQWICYDKEGNVAGAGPARPIFEEF